MTEMEQTVFEAIRDNTDEESMECVDIEDLVSLTGIASKQIRGVLSSLVKKEKIEVEEYDANFNTQYFYWVA